MAHGKCLWNIVLICWSHTQTRTLYTFEISRRLTIFKSIIWTLLNHILTMFESSSLASIVMSNNVIHSAKSRLLKRMIVECQKIYIYVNVLYVKVHMILSDEWPNISGWGWGGGVKDKRILTYMYKNIYHMLSSICGRYHPCYKKISHDLQWYTIFIRLVVCFLSHRGSPRPGDRKHTRWIKIIYHCKSLFYDYHIIYQSHDMRSNMLQWMPIHFSLTLFPKWPVSIKLPKCDSKYVIFYTNLIVTSLCFTSDTCPWLTTDYSRINGLQTC